MAMVYKCDRCGQVFDNPNDGGGNGPYVWDAKMSPDQEHFDLCNKCYKSLVQWIRNPEEIHTYKYMIEDTKCCLTCKHLNCHDVEKCPDCGDNYSKWEAKDNG